MKAKPSKIDDCSLWYWRILLRIPWTTSHSLLDGLKPVYSQEALTMKPKFTYSGHIMLRQELLEKILCLKKKVGRKWDKQKITINGEAIAKLIRTQVGINQQSWQNNIYLITLSEDTKTTE